MGERPHKRLHVWQKAMELAEMTYRLTEDFPRTEQFGLTGQMRRAAASVPTNIAEGAARHSANETYQFYFISRGSVFECVPLIELGFELGLIVEVQKTELRDDLQAVCQMLTKLIQSLKET